MTWEIGIACGACDTYSSLGTACCPSCGNEFGLEDRMEQAKHYVCTGCATAVPSGHKFCGSCGAPVPADVVKPQFEYFGNLQTPGNARLTLIRGDAGMDGLSYMLQGVEHLAGRQEGLILFPDDIWLSPRHANFVYDKNKLVVRDEGSLNGVYIRIREPVKLAFGEHFLCGEQLFRVQALADEEAGPGGDETYFYASPKRPGSFQVVQVLRGGQDGIALTARGDRLDIGREGVDLNFPQDVYMSAKHSRLERADDGVLLTDLSSRNGSYVRIKQSQELQNGDYIFVGKQLLRVEMTLA